MAAREQLVTDELAIWSSAIQIKTGVGAGKSNKLELYGIKKLREMISELAVRGLLVPQDPNDEPARALLKKIAAEKAQLVKEGKVKKQELLPPIQDDEKPFELPERWEWVRFGEIAQHNAGKTLDKGRNTGEPRDYLTTSNLYWGRFDLSEVRQMLIKQDELEKCTARKGDLLICEGGEAGRAAVWNEDREICFQNHVHRARFFGDVNPYYAYRYFEKLAASGEIENYRKGVGISNMSGKALASIIFALPPAQMQHRIVAKVDDLMAVCDQLEQQQETSITAHQTLVQTLLDALTTVSDRDGFTAAWARIAEHFDTLFTTDWSIDQLKQSILQLAVMGKLVRQDPNDLPASALLRRIAAEKAELVEDGKIKKKKPLPPIEEHEKLFELPEGWEWARVIDLSTVGTGATPSRDNSSYYAPSEYSWVTSGETSSEFIFETKECVSAKAIKETNVSIYPVGTLIVAMYGQGKTRGQITELKIEAGTNQACAAIQLVEASANHRAYIKLSFKKAYEELRSHAAGGAQPNLNVGKISRTVVPVPPLKEQERIVAKVEKLMAVCDTLKTRIDIARTNQLRLADAMVEKALT